MSKSNIAKILHLFADIQADIHNGTIHHKLNQILRYTRDEVLHNACYRAAECLNIELDSNFRNINNKQHRDSLNTLIRHLKGIINNFDKINKFDEISALINESNPGWPDETFKAVEALFYATEH